MAPIELNDAESFIVADEENPQCRRCCRYDEVSERGLCESCDAMLAEDVALESYLDEELLW